MNAVIERFMWNMYYPNQESFVHTDVDKDKDNFLSILYNLNTTSGGTKIKDVFYKDQENSAALSVHKCHQLFDRRSYGYKRILLFPIALFV